MGSVKLEETIAHHRWAADNCVGEVRDEHSQMVGWLEELVRLRAENAQMRETCLDAHEWMGRALYDGSARRYEYESITERMRELGVEVEDE